MTIGPILVKTLLSGKVEPQPCPPARQKVIVAVAALTVATVALDPLAVAIALPSMREDIAASFLAAQWVLIVHGLVLAGLIPIGARLGRNFGQSRMLGIGLLISALAAIASGLVGRVDLLLAVRAVAGFAAALSLPAALGLIAVNFPRARRATALERMTLTSILLLGLGAIAAGGAVTFLSWPGVFWLEGALALITFALLRLGVPIDFPELEHTRLDLIGAMVLIAAWVLILFGLSLPGTGQNGLAAFFLVVAGLVGILLFGFWETSATRDPMISVATATSMRFVVANGLVGLGQIGIVGALFLLPSLLIAGLGRSPATASLAFTVTLMAMLMASVRADAVAARLGGPVTVAVGYSLAAAALLALALTTLKGLFWLGALPAAAVLGLGIGLAAPIALRAGATAARALQAGELQNMVIRLANAAAIAAVGAIACLFYRDVLTTLAPVLAGAPGGSDFAGPVDGSPDLLSIRTDAIRLAFTRTAVVCAAACGLAGLAALAFLHTGNRPAPAQAAPRSPAAGTRPAPPAVRPRPTDDGDKHPARPPNRRGGARRITPPRTSARSRPDHPSER